MFKKYILRIIVLISVLVTILINALANILPINGYSTGELSDDIPIYFVPAGYVFAIWGLIYISIFFYSVYNFFNHSEKEKGIYIAFTISNIANIIWIFLWHYKLVLLSVLPMLIILLALLYIYSQQLKAKTTILKKFPFQVYLGWISVATIANISGALYVAGWNGFGFNPELWAAIMIGIASLLAVLMITTQRDFIYPLVVIWAVLGILLRFLNSSDIVLTASLLSLIMIIGIYIFNLFLKNKEN